LLQTYRIPQLLVFASHVFYFSFAYQLERSDFIKLLSLYVVLFSLFLQTSANQYREFQLPLPARHRFKDSFPFCKTQPQTIK